MPITDDDHQLKTFLVHRTKIFDRTLEELQRKGGSAEIAANKAELLIRQLTASDKGNLRKQFRFTRNGENRITYCGKYDLGCGYRLVFVRRSGYIAFLYIGAHDDCFRWINRNKGRNYEFSDAEASTEVVPDKVESDSLSTDEKCGMGTDEYEEQLMSRIDDRILRKIFSGFAADEKS